MESAKGFASPLLIVGVVAGVLAVGLAIQTKRVESCKKEYAEFVAKVEQLGKQAEAEKARKEKENADKITTALADRDAALKRLRDANSRGRKLSDNTAAASASGRVSIATPSYDAAMGQFRKELERVMAGARAIATECDAANIDASTLIKAWPK